jgi:hypothetical protein
MKKCRECGIEKPITEFYSHKSVPKPQCKPCYIKRYGGPKTPERKEYERQWRERNRDRVREISRNNYRKRKAADPLYGRIHHLGCVFGLTVAEAREIEAIKQCEICGAEAPEHRALDVDHNHTTGRVRGKLCRACNHGIGNFKDNPDLLLKAVDYLLERDVCVGS